MYKKLLLTILSLFAFSSYSQTFEWLATTTIDFSMNSDLIGYTIASDPSGNIYMTGFKDNAFPYEDIMGAQYYNKYDANGNLLFSKEIDGNVNIYNIATDTEGNLIMMLGYVQSISIGTLDLISINQGVNYMMIKFNPEGNVLWYHEFYLAASFVSGARGLAFDTENNIYVSYDDYMHSYIEKLSPAGTILSTESLSIEASSFWFCTNLVFISAS